jgi:hypothetical protein
VRGGQYSASGGTMRKRECHSQLCRFTGIRHDNPQPQFDLHVYPSCPRELRLPGHGQLQPLHHSLHHCGGLFRDHHADRIVVSPLTRLPALRLRRGWKPPWQHRRFRVRFTTSRPTSLRPPPRPPRPTGMPPDRP